MKKYKVILLSLFLVASLVSFAQGGQSETEIPFSTLLEQRFSTAYLSANCEVCEERVWSPPAECNDVDAAAQDDAILDVIEQIKVDISTGTEVECQINGVDATQMVYELNMDELQLPLTIAHIATCSGKESFILSTSLDQIDAYTLVDEIVIADYLSTYEVYIDGTLRKLNLRELLELLYINMPSAHDIIKPADYIDYGEVICETIVSTCTPEQKVKQSEALRIIELNAKDMAISYPTQINLVDLCDGTKVWILDQEMPFLKTTNAGEPIDNIIVTDADQLITICAPVDGLGDEQMIDVRLTHPTCEPGSTGTIYIDVADAAVGRLSMYSIDGGMTLQSHPLFQDLAPGVYPILVTDDTQSIITFDGNVKIDTPICPEICDNGIDDDGDGNIDCADGDCGLPEIKDISVSDVSCPNPASGSIVITAESTAEMSYSIDGGETWQDNHVFQNLIAGGYTIVVKSLHSTYSCDGPSKQVIIRSATCVEICGNGKDDDGNGLSDSEDPACDGGDAFSITSVNSVQPTSALCPNPADGNITITSTGRDVAYSIDDGATFTRRGNFDGLFPGTYNIKIKNLLNNEIKSYANNPIVLAEPVCVEICDNGIDDDGDNLIDCEDDDCINGASSQVNICDFVGDFTATGMASDQVLLVFEDYDQFRWDVLIEDESITKIDIVVNYTGKKEIDGVDVTSQKSERYSLYDGEAVDLGEIAFLLYEFDADYPMTISLDVGTNNLCTQSCDDSKTLSVEPYVDEVEIIEEENPVVELPAFECGDTYVPPAIDPNAHLMESITAGDILYFNGFPIIAGGGTSCTNGDCEGSGTLALPFNKKTVSVTFDLSGVNIYGQATSGTVTAMGENTDFMTLDPTTSNGDIDGWCKPPPPPPNLVAGNIDPVTGLNEWGFDPETGLHDVTGTAYDEGGFDINGNHKETGTQYNEVGCNRENLDIDNNFCGLDPALQEFLDSKEAGLNGEVTDIISALGGEVGEDIETQRASCEVVRTQLDDLYDTHLDEGTSLKIKREFIFGPGDIYIDEGMSDHFTQRPKQLVLNIDRNEKIEELEELHLELYDCDKALASLKDLQTGIATDIDASVIIAELKKRMAQIDEALLIKLEDPTFYEEWLKTQVEEIIAASADDADIGSIQVEDLMRSFRMPKMSLRPSGILSTTAATNDFWPEDLTEREQLRKEVEYGIANGHTYINGVHRAFFLEQIVKERRKYGFSSLVNGNSLPIEVEKIIAGVKYTILLDKIKFSTEEGATLSAHIILEDPTDASRRLVFGAENLGFGPTGLGGGGVSRLSLVSDVDIVLNNSAKLVLLGSKDGAEPKDNSTYVEWDCSGFVAANIAGDIVFCRDFILPVDEAGANVPDEFFKINVQTKIFDWLDFYFDTQGGDADVQYKSFRMTEYQDVTWTLDQMIIDMSANETPRFVPPVGYDSPDLLSSNTLSPEWKGFYIRELSATLPNQFKPSGGDITLAVEDLLIDGTGVSVSVLYQPDEPIIALGEGSAGGWPFSVNDFGLKVLHNHIAGGEFNGEIEIPVFTEPLAYEAIIYPGDYYKFAISPDPKVEYTMDVFIATATLEDNTTVELELKDGEFTALANLSGTLKVDESKTTDYKIKIPELAFSGFRVSNKAPYFDPGQWEMIGDDAGKFGVFGVDIANIQPYKGDNEEEAGLGFDLLIDLADEIGLKANASIGLLGHLAENEADGDASYRQKWMFKEVEVRSAYIDQDIKDVLHVKGGLTFFKEKENFGQGFEALLSADFKKLNFSVEASAMFGKIGDFNYFFVDALTELPISLGVGPLNIVGFGGGVSYHMSSEFEGERALFGGPPVPGVLGQSFTGINYTPDKTIGLGLHASVLFAHSKEELFNGSVSLGIVFNDEDHGGGINEMFLRGNGHFLNPLDKTELPEKNEVSDTLAPPPRVSSALSAWLEMKYNFNEKVFNGELGVYLNQWPIEGRGVNGRLALATMHFAPTAWYINIGTPTDRAGAQVEIPILGTVDLSAYFNVGTTIPDFPGLPPNVRQLTGLVDNNEDLRKSGGGIMFGADLKAEVEIDAFIAKASVNGQLGFDIMLRNYGDALCVNADDPEDPAVPVGIDGWYAAGQMYAFLEGKLELFGINVLNAGLAAALQARLPNPFWAQAAVGFRVKLLFFSKMINANVAFGKRCIIVDDTGEEKIGLEVVMYSDPVDAAEDVNVDVQPTLYLGVPLKKKFQLGDDTYEVSNLQVSLSTPDYQVSTRVGNSDSEYKYTIIPNEVLPGNTEMTLTTIATVTKNGAPFDEEVRTFIFTTGENLDIIPESNVEYSYPVRGQYDFFADEYNQGQGYIKLVAGQAQLLEGAEIRLTGQASGAKTHSLSYDSERRLISFSLSSANVNPGEVYKLEIIKEEIPLYEMIFRASEYATYRDKIDKVREYTALSYNGERLRNRLIADISEMEAWGEAHIYGSEKSDALISWRVDLDNEYYTGSRGWNNLIYDHFPLYDRSCGNITYDDNIPLDESGGIEQSGEVIVVADQTLYHSGTSEISLMEQRLTYEAMRVTGQHFQQLRTAAASCILNYDYSKAHFLRSSNEQLKNNNPEDAILLELFHPATVAIYRSFVRPTEIPFGNYKLHSTYTLPGGITTSREEVIIAVSSDNSN